uniref:Uncharacterized protein n=1 Tax=Magallana gigas TaxID=29159 RepID=A0A8W8L076_MAGGI
MSGPRYDSQKCMGKVLIVNNQTYSAKKKVYDAKKGVDKVDDAQKGIDKEDDAEKDVDCRPINKDEEDKKLEGTRLDSMDTVHQTGTQAPKPVKIPIEADFLTYTCVRDRAITTWNEGLKEYVQKPKQPLEIQTLLTRMNRLYWEYYSNEGMRVDTPCVTSLLTREAYLKTEEPSTK